MICIVLGVNRNNRGNFQTEKQWRRSWRTHSITTRWIVTELICIGYQIVDHYPGFKTTSIMLDFNRNNAVERQMETLLWWLLSLPKNAIRWQCGGQRGRSSDGHMCPNSAPESNAIKSKHQRQLSGDRIESTGAGTGRTMKLESER